MTRLENPGRCIAALLILLCFVMIMPAVARGEKDYLDLADLVNQVKLAFLDAAARTPPKGALRPKEILLELQGVTTTEVDGQYKILFFSAGAKLRKENAQIVAVTLAPVSEPILSLHGSVASALSDAILSVYYAVSAGAPEYQLRKGQVELRCAVTNDGKLGLALTPLSANIDYAKSLIQKVTIVF